MVKKKTRRKVIKAPIPKLDTIFNCPLCGQKKTVAVTFDKKINIGYLRCKACKKSYESKIKRADTFIDIYYRWVNQLEKDREKELEEEEQLEKSDEESEKEKENDKKEEESEDHEKHRESDDHDYSLENADQNSQDKEKDEDFEENNEENNEENDEKNEENEESSNKE